MKNVCLKLAIISTIVAATTAFADNAVQMKGYFSTQNPAASLKGPGPLKFPPTDITITNNSTREIHVVVPGTSIHDLVYPTVKDHIRNSQGAFFTTITLEDPYHTAFWSAVVCPRALVDVYSTMSGGYTIKVDNEYCL